MSPAVTRLPSFRSWLARTDPRDVARVESKTVIVTREQRDAVPTPPGGDASQLGRWMSPEEFDKAMARRFPGCMKGTVGEETVASAEPVASSRHLTHAVCPQAAPCT